MFRKHIKRLVIVNMKKTGLKVYVYDFSVDYDAIAASDALNIPRYLMKKNEIVSKCLDL